MFRYGKLTRSRSEVWHLRHQLPMQPVVAYHSREDEEFDYESVYSRNTAGLTTPSPNEDLLWLNDADRMMPTLFCTRPQTQLSLSTTGSTYTSPNGESLWSADADAFLHKYTQTSQTATTPRSCPPRHNVHESADLYHGAHVDQIVSFIILLDTTGTINGTGWIHAAALRAVGQALQRQH
jgi:hypothetical protein